MHSRNSKTTKQKHMRKHRNKYEITGALNKHQTETKITISREINELR
jgi:hypothetical protein